MLESLFQLCHPRTIMDESIAMKKSQTSSSVADRMAAHPRRGSSLGLAPKQSLKLRLKLAGSRKPQRMPMSARGISRSRLSIMTLARLSPGLRMTAEAGYNAPGFLGDCDASFPPRAR
ncbi:hypothetical protein ACMDCR_06490 [Labrys okinawensis]|uniref:hypothetical protein n=1 Tax=Labrys okinawensis TaxID=346911 RepID=UPI0039BD33D9